MPGFGPASQRLTWPLRVSCALVLVLVLAATLAPAAGATSFTVPTTEAVDNVAYAHAVTTQTAFEDAGFATKILLLSETYRQDPDKAKLLAANWIDPAATAIEAAWRGVTDQGQTELMGIPLDSWKRAAAGTAAMAAYASANPAATVPAALIGGTAGLASMYFDYIGTQVVTTRGLTPATEQAPARTQLDELARDAFMDLRAEARGPSGAALSRAFDTVFPKLQNVLAETSAKPILAQDPALRQELTDAGIVDASTGDLDSETRGGVSVVPMDSTELSTELNDQNQVILSKVATAAASMQAVASKQGSLDAYAADTALREQTIKQAQDAAAQVEAGLNGTQAVVNIISTFVAKSDPQTAKEFKAVATGGISVARSICSFALTAAKLGSVLTPIGLFTGLSAIGDIVGSIQGIAGAFGPAEPDPNKLIFEAITGLQTQIRQLSSTMNERFDRVDKALNTVFSTMTDQFARVNAHLATISGEMQRTTELLGETRLDLARVAHDATLFAGADAQSHLLETYGEVFKWKHDHPGAQLPLTDFLRAESTFLDYAERVAWWDPRLGGDTSGSGPAVNLARSSDDINLRLSQYIPVERNLQYLGNVAGTLLSAPLGFTSELPNPVDFVIGARLFAAFSAQWPELAAADRAPDGSYPALDRLQETARSLQRQITGMSRNRTLFDNLVQRYENGAASLRTALAGVSDRTLTIGGPSSAIKSWDGAAHRAASWAVWAAPDGNLPRGNTVLAWVPNCSGGGSLSSPANITFANGYVPGSTVANDLGTRKSDLCWRSAYTGDGLLKNKLEIQMGNLVWDSPTSNAWLRSWRIEITKPGECALTLNAFTCVVEQWPALRDLFGATASRTDDLTAQSALVAANAPVQSALRQAWYDRTKKAVSQDGTEPDVRSAALRLEADRKLLAAYLDIGFPEAMLTDEYLSSLTHGAALVTNDGAPRTISSDGGLIGCRDTAAPCDDLVSWVGAQLENLNGDQQLDRLAAAASGRASDLLTRIHAYQDGLLQRTSGQRTAATYQEANPMVAQTIGELDLLRFRLQHTTPYVTAHGGTTTGGDATPSPAPVLTALRISPRRFRHAARGGSITTAKVPRTGAKVSYRDSRAATTTFTVARAQQGLKHGSACVKPTARLRRGRAHPCTRYTAVKGSFIHHDKAGANAFHFSGRMRSRALARGSYRLSATPRIAGVAGKTATKTFTVTG